ncbi:hypothetical protein [Dankookia sp. P2]|uniref:hypothetical protein n=1 Tax=Dankookia sp. P2 TaxID=3423955 RepID=UPI003D66671F
MVIVGPACERGACCVENALLDHQALETVGCTVKPGDRQLPLADHPHQHLEVVAAVQERTSRILQ